MKTDVAIVGGGIAGLWLLNRLKKLGYDAHLFEKTALGTGQTIASQGVIHGGRKFLFTKKQSALSEMPHRWIKCLNGYGEIDLSNVQVLATTQELKFTNYLMRPIASLLLGKSTHNGKLLEPVIDVKSLLEELQKPYADYIYQGMQPTGKDRAQATIHVCGIGNMDYCSLKQIQMRPLRMFMVRPAPFSLYAHIFSWFSHRPELTITTHYHENQLVWYIGGALAENRWATIEDAKRALSKHYAGINWNRKKWAYVDVMRSEPATENGRLPDGPQFISTGNFAVAWPCKLALAPLLADKMIEWLESRQITPKGRDTILDFPRPKVAQYPWENAEWK